MEELALRMGERNGGERKGVRRWGMKPSVFLSKEGHFKPLGIKEIKLWKSTKRVHICR